MENIKDIRRNEDAGFENGRITQDRYQKRQLLDLLVMILILVQSALSYDSVRKKKFSKFSKIFKKYNKEFEGNYNFGTQKILYLCMLMTILCWICTFMKEFLFLEILKERGFEGDKATIFSTGKIWHIFKECAILGLQPLPFFLGKRIYFFNDSVQGETYYYWNDIMNILASLRLTYFLSSALFLTKWKSCSADRVW